MNDYDAAFKLTIPGLDLVLRDWIGAPVVRWRNVELPEMQTPRVDLLGETSEGDLVHIEAQSRNDPTMALRMAEYGLRVLRATGHFPVQIVMYFGEAVMRMPDRLQFPNAEFAYRLVDVRSFAIAPLIESSSLDDNILALFTGAEDPRPAVQHVLKRIVELPEHKRESALKRVITLSGLRKRLAVVLEEEARKMPITEDILDHPILGPRIIQGIKQGREEGRREGELALATGLIAKRLGPVPAWVGERLSALSPEELLQVGLRVLEAESFQDLFR